MKILQLIKQHKFKAALLVLIAIGGLSFAVLEFQTKEKIVDSKGGSLCDGETPIIMVDQCSGFQE